MTIQPVSLQTWRLRERVDTRTASDVLRRLEKEGAIGLVRKGKAHSRDSAARPAHGAIPASVSAPGSFLPSSIWAISAGVTPIFSAVCSCVLPESALCLPQMDEGCGLDPWGCPNGS